MKVDKNTHTRHIELKVQTGLKAKAERWGRIGLGWVEVVRGRWGGGMDNV